MISTPTLFALGAGASVPYGFPTAEELRQRISFRHLNPSWEDDTKKQKKAGEDLLRFQLDVRRSNLAPFDKFAESMDLTSSVQSKERLTLWRLVLATIILGRELVLREAHSVMDPLKTVAISAFEQPEANWFPELFSEMAEGVHDPSRFFEDNKVSFVTFNYDRLLEFLLVDSLATTFFGGDVDLAIKVFEKCDIRHVHGQVGKFEPGEFHRLDRGEDAIPFGDHKSTSIRIAARQLVFAHTKREAPPQHFRMSDGSVPRRVAFLGFGFDPDNCKVFEGLQVAAHARHENLYPTQVYATMYGETKSGWQARAVEGYSIREKRIFRTIRPLLAALRE